MPDPRNPKQDNQMVAQQAPQAWTWHSGTTSHNMLCMLLASADLLEPMVATQDLYHHRWLHTLLAPSLSQRPHPHPPDLSCKHFWMGHIKEREAPIGFVVWHWTNKLEGILTITCRQLNQSTSIYKCCRKGIWSHFAFLEGGFGPRGASRSPFERFRACFIAVSCWRSGALK